MHRKFLVHVYPVRPCVPPRFLSLGFFPGLPNRSTTLTIHSRERECVSGQQKNQGQDGVYQKTKNKNKKQGELYYPVTSRRRE